MHHMRGLFRARRETTMSICQVNGTLADLGLTPVAGAEITFTAASNRIGRDGNTLILAEPETVVTGAGGTFTANLVAGRYRVSVTGQEASASFFATVQEGATVAQLAQLIDLPAPPTLNAAQQAVVDAQTARDVANASATAAAASATAANTAQTGAEAASDAASASASAAGASGAAAEAARVLADQLAAAALLSQQGAAVAAMAAMNSQTAAAASETASVASASAASTWAATASAASTAAQAALDAAVGARNEALAAESAAESSAFAASGSASAAAGSATSAAQSASTADTRSMQAALSAAAANASAGQSAGSAAQALAIYGSAEAQQAAVANAQNQASLAAGFAASAASVVQQDLSGINVQALHRSPNATTAMFIYDTSKDSDGGAWTEKCQHTSWWNEPLMGKWLGPATSELDARSAGGPLGSNIAVGGDFASATGWTLQSGASISGNVLSFAGTGAAIAQRAQSFVAGRIYKITFTIASVSGGFVTCGVRNTANTLFLATTGNLGAGTYEFVVVPDGTSNLLRFSASSASTVATISGFSVREVTALTTASGDYYQLTTDGKFYRLWKNLLSRSEQFDNAVWVKQNSSVTATSAQSPPTASGSFFLKEDASTNFHRTFQQFTPLSGVGYTFSVYAKSDGNRHIQLNLGSAGFGQTHANFDLINGQVGALSNLTAAIQSVGGGWYRCTVTGTAITSPTLADVTCCLVTSPTAARLQSYTGDNTSGVFIWGAQLELGSTATTYERKVADGSQTEVFRGNKADFPRLAGIVAEATSVNIYDLTEAGRPMFARFIATATATISAKNMLSGANSVTALNGRLIVGGSGTNLTGLTVVDFIRDSAELRLTSGYAWNGGISTRNSTGGYGAVDANVTGIVNATANAVAATTLPDAPVDPVTGLRVPTIAVATNGGVSVIQHSGTVRNSSSTSSFDTIALTPSLLSAGRADGTWYSAANPGALGASFALAQRTNTQAPGFSIGNTSKLVEMGRSRLLRRSSTAARAQMARAHESDPSRSLVATVGDVFNTGWQTGDIRRTFLSDTEVGSVTGPATVADRSYKAAGASITGTLTRAQLASGTSLVAYSGWSAENYLREPYSADLDFGTGEWTASAWVNVPATLPASSFPTVGAEIFAGSLPATIANPGTTSLSIGSVTAGKAYRVTVTTSANPGTVGATFRISGSSGNLSPSGSVSAGFVGTVTHYFVALVTGSFSLNADNTGTNMTLSAVSLMEVAPALVFDRAAASGPALRLGVQPNGRLLAEAFDGTTTRTVTSTASYATAQWLKARVNYTTDGSLALVVNGREVAVTRGNPLLTLNNASAVLTIGNSFATDAPFPGSIALLKLGATVPTPEQATFMYEQEKQLFRAGALSVLPDSGAIVDMAYDDATDRWVAISASNESYWTGLVRNSVTPVPAGSYTRVVATSGVELAARSTTNPGVDVTIPAYGLREELVKRAEAASRLSRELAVYDYVGGFTANTTSGSTAITSVANLTYPTSYIGARVSGTGIPANTTIVAVSGTTIYLSAAATATATGVSISFVDFILPVGLEAKIVFLGGDQQREGSTAAYVRLFDGFREAIRFNTAPAATAVIQIQATRGAV